jgi:biotin-dependent carboxylase-like uncharacterized protein
VTARLVVEKVSPGVTIQDRGRSGRLAYGLSRGGAADRFALAEGAALLGQSPDLAALEMAWFGGHFRAEGNIRIALTGAPMAASVSGEPLAWNSSHMLREGEVLSVGAAQRGLYGYLHVGGGVDTPQLLGSRSVHFAGGIGAAVDVGDRIPIGKDASGEIGLTVEVADRYSGGTLRILPSVHTDLFDLAIRTRFEATEFRRGARCNRQGAELNFDGAPFSAGEQLSILSEPMVPGDIQMTGHGLPFVLLPECQATGGYPRIGTILPDDLPVVAQATPDVLLRFRFVDHAEALAGHVPLDDLYRDLKRRVRPRVRSVADIPVGELLGFQLISGVIAGNEDLEETT